ncbi:unnamed protein product [Lactuca saligna]|uniref:SWIM-type domain-containing protein n=1 Tax=Lactuca saligna TaxID=75948 RepID=A0AA35YBU0_LACSI|nr:unnamed protein product [Lactuca saligna]
MVNRRIRQEWEEYDLQSSYADNLSMFSIRLNYGGVFTKFPGRKYIKGKMNYIDDIDSDLFLVHDMDEIMELIDCVEPSKSIYYHFKRLTWDLDFGLYSLVNMEQQTCSCNGWELTGIPCKHSIAVICYMRLNNENVGILETWVHPIYWLKTWKEMYVLKVEPINGRFCGKKAHVLPS